MKIVHFNEASADAKLLSMKLPTFFKKKQRPPLSAAQRRFRAYAKIFIGLLALAILPTKNSVSDAIAGSMLFAGAFFVGMLLLHKEPWKKGMPTALVAGAFSIAGVFIFTILMSAIYVARHGQAVVAHEGYGTKLLGLALIVIIHALAFLLARKYWPDQTTRNSGLKA